MARITYVPSTHNDSAATFVVGQIYDNGGNLYRYVQFVDAVAYAAGHVVCWANTAENCAKYLRKGRKVQVEGKLSTRIWEDKEGNKRYTTEIVARNVTFL